MNMITIILAFCGVMWYIIDNLKEKLWGGHTYSSYITIVVSALSAFALTFSYGLDIVYALELAEDITILGQIITALAMMSGSAVVSELVELFRAK